MQQLNTAIALSPEERMRGTGFLQETPGNSSAMRLMCMMSLVTAITLSAFVIATPPPPYESRDVNGQRSLVYPPRDPQGFYLIYAFLIAAFAPKAVQKFAEQKIAAFDPSQPLPQPTTVMLPQAQAIPVQVVQQPAQIAAVASQPVQAQVVPTQPTQANGSGIVSQPVAALTTDAAIPGVTRIQALKNRGGL